MKYLECVCSSMQEIILDNKAIEKEMFYEKLLKGMIEDTNASESKEIKKSNNKSKIKGREYIQQRIRGIEEKITNKEIKASIEKVGGIECLLVEKDELEIAFFRKKTFSEYEINLIRHLIGHIHFKNKAKYIVAITKDCEGIQEICTEGGIRFKKIGECYFVNTQKYVAEIECMNKKILPNIEEYMEEFEARKQIPVRERYMKLQGDEYILNEFVEYLKEIIKKDVSKRFGK